MINRIFPAILLIGFSIVLVAQTNDQVIVENYQKFNRNEAVRCILIDKKNFKCATEKNFKYQDLAFNMLKQTK